ncbi:MAG: hypothetical protein ACOXZZ_01430 [Sphaerochaetaceae bacterium]
MKQTILANGRILQTMEPVTVSDGLDIVIEGDKIIDVGKNMAVSYPEAKIIDVGGKTIIPGNVCSHHHYYSGLSTRNVGQLRSPKRFYSSS